VRGSRRPRRPKAEPAAIPMSHAAPASERGPLSLLPGSAAARGGPGPGLPAPVRRPRSRTPAADRARIPDAGPLMPAPRCRIPRAAAAASPGPPPPAPIPRRPPPDAAADAPGPPGGRAATPRPTRRPPGDQVGRDGRLGRRWKPPHPRLGCFPRGPGIRRAPPSERPGGGVRRSWFFEPSRAEGAFGSRTSLRPSPSPARAASLPRSVGRFFRQIRSASGVSPPEGRPCSGGVRVLRVARRPDDERAHARPPGASDRAPSARSSRPLTGTDAPRSPHPDGNARPGKLPRGVQNR